jgi:hypothetical protein
MTSRTKLIWLFIIGLGFFVAKYTQPTKSAPPPQAAKEEILETAAPPEADSPAGQVNNSIAVPIKEVTRRKEVPSSPRISQRQIEDSIRADMYCDNDGSYRLDPKLFKNEEDRRLRIFESLAEINFRTKAHERVLTALLSRQREMVLAKLTACPSEECLFLKAIVLTNQIAVKGESLNPDQDMRMGLSVLKTLKFMNQDNGVYPYFMLWPLQKLGEKYNLKLAFKDFLRAPRFENPLIQAYVALAQAGQFNATAHLYADEFTSIIGVPEYGKATPVITDLIKNKDFDTELSSWAKNRLEDFDLIKARNLSAPVILIVELAQLKSLARVFWEKAGTAGPAPQIFGAEGFNEFMKLRSDLGFEGSHLQEDSRTTSHCLAAWDLKREIQSRYSQSLAEMIHRWETP